MLNLLVIGHDPHSVKRLVLHLRHSLNDCRPRIDIVYGMSSAVLVLHTHRYEAIFLKPFMAGRLNWIFVEQLRSIQPLTRVFVLGPDERRSSIEVFPPDADSPPDGGQIYDVLASVTDAWRSATARKPRKEVSRTRRPFVLRTVFLRS
jgi:hypothetical protein